MSLIPDVPLAVVVLHFAALGAIIVNSIIASHRRSAFLRGLQRDEL